MLKFQLRTPVRHDKDLDYVTFLNIIRHRKPTQHEIDEAFKGLDVYVTREQVRCRLYQLRTRHYNPCQHCSTYSLLPPHAHL
jgi:hypothetical protein